MSSKKGADGFAGQLTSAAYTASEPSDILSAPALKYLEATSTAEYVCQHKRVYTRSRSGTVGRENGRTVGREKARHQVEKMTQQEVVQEKTR